VKDTEALEVLVVGALRFWLLVFGALRFWVMVVGDWLLTLTASTGSSIFFQSKCEGH
jgi:hypothetical protein